MWPCCSAAVDLQHSDRQWLVGHNLQNEALRDDEDFALSHDDRPQPQQHLAR